MIIFDPFVGIADDVSARSPLMAHCDSLAMVTFSTATSGYVVVAQGGHIISGSISAASIDGLDGRIKTKLNAEGVFSSSAQITMGGDVSGTANAVVISSIDGGTV